MISSSKVIILNPVSKFSEIKEYRKFMIEELINDINIRYQ
jgi:hypothetical protein